MEKIKIAVLDHEVGCHGHPKSLFEVIFKSNDLIVIFNETVDSFKETLAKDERWDIVVINFQTPDFFEMNMTAMSDFVRWVAGNQPVSSRFIAITGDQRQKEMLEELKITVIHKVYPLYEIQRLCGRHSEGEKITIELIQKEVCDRFEVHYERLLQKTRKREIVQARQVTMYLAKMFTANSLKAIGEHFGGRDHTTVIHSCQTVKDLMDTNSDFKIDVTDLINKLGMIRLMHPVISAASIS